ncbi:MAG TPA: molybdopterin cofactor-binding domain-containing protein [Rhizomicrobium sp.]|nr:molybdopterin cofactor-binding domain-containing protein [Rhizomicrobium sp.]
MTAILQTSRRGVLSLFGGVVVFFGLNPLAKSQGWPPYPSDFHAYLLVNPNGRITVFSGKIEMGQGVLTSQAQMAAEELGVEVASIDMILGDTDKCPWDMGTFGSLTTRMFGPHLRAAAAKARSVLVGLAAKRLGADPEALAVNNGVVFVKTDPQRKVSYGSLASDVHVAESVSADVPLRTPAEFTVMGKSIKRLDGVAKVTGGAKYAADLRLPGMLYAHVLHPAVHGGKIVSADMSAAEKIPGAVVVKRDDLIAALHADPQIAANAAAKIIVQQTTTSWPLDPDNIFAHFEKVATEVKVVQSRGDAANAKAARTFEAAYYKGYVAHSPLEPHAALADVKDGRATVWASTQTPFPVRDQIAETLKLDKSRVRVVTPFLGGGFGGKSASLQAIQAARLSQIVGRPVQVAWTREEEFYYDTFDPAAAAKIRAGLSADNKIAFWDYDVYAAAGRGASLFYDVPNVRVRSLGGMSFELDAAKAGLHPFAVGPWRAPGANMNVFAIESQIDMLAAAAKTDPVAFRFAHLSDARFRNVLKACADRFGWRSAARAGAQGQGVALSSDAGSVVATMADVKVDRATGEVKVERIVSAIDAGQIVNPEGARMQCEGGLTQGLGYTFSEELRFKGGEILDTNFDTYELPRFSRVPPIEIVLVKNDALAPQGVGEPSITTTGAAIANAVFDATGARVNRLPLTRARVLAALAESEKTRSG